MVLPLDNSGGHIGLASIPVTTQPMKLGIGQHTIKYLAKDKMGNRASCQFSITVMGEGGEGRNNVEYGIVQLVCTSPVDIHAGEN